jgi:hypothetical protein
MVGLGVEAHIVQEMFEGFHGFTFAVMSYFYYTSNHPISTLFLTILVFML